MVTMMLRPEIGVVEDDVEWKGVLEGFEENRGSVSWLAICYQNEETEDLNLGKGRAVKTDRSPRLLDRT